MHARRALTPGSLGVVQYLRNCSLWEASDGISLQTRWDSGTPLWRQQGSSRSGGSGVLQIQRGRTAGDVGYVGLGYRHFVRNRLLVDGATTQQEWARATFALRAASTVEATYSG